MSNLNVLSDRYVTDPVNNIFSPRGIVLSSRELWIAVMQAQKELGMDIPLTDIEKYIRAKGDIDFDLIRRIERETRHDVKAGIQAFVAAAGAGQYIHQGMTSRDSTDNVEQLQIRQAAIIILGKYISILRHLLDNAKEYKYIILTARTHHQAAQPTLLGRRFSMWAEELLFHIKTLILFIENYPLRGIKGPVGTQFDMLTLLGSPEKVEALEKIVANKLGFAKVLNSPGQVYPRSMDYALLSQLALLSSACESFAKTMRLMAGYELATEGFKDGQVGSTAMPHKMNTRSSERICGFSNLLKMYADGASRISGDQWEEGDVSCSVVRRIITPDAFYTSDGLCETTLTVLNEMGPYPVIIDNEVDRYLPFLATTEILMLAIKLGIGREIAHEVIKQHSRAVALQMRETGVAKNNLPELLAQDSIFVEAGIEKTAIQEILSDKKHFIGNATQQIDDVVSAAEEIINRYNEEAKYEPEEIL